jgi:4'-phosphopantetheinyl transferase
LWLTVEKTNTASVTLNVVSCFKDESILEVVILRAIPDLTGDQYDVLLPLVSSEKQKQINQLCFFQDKQNALLGDILARTEICRITGLSNSQLEFAVNPYGKPFLANNLQIHHNIAHTDQHIACVIGEVSVGIDIERIRPIDMKIVERFFVSEEKNYILSAQSDLRNKRFFEVWTKKESRIKLEGKRLLESLSAFNVLTLEPGIFYHCVYNNGETIGHMCSSHKESPLIKEIDTTTLLQYASLLK